VRKDDSFHRSLEGRIREQSDQNRCTGVKFFGQPPPLWFTATAAPTVGTWLSLVEHSLGVRGVGSSNLPVPTNLRKAVGRVLHFVQDFANGLPLRSRPLNGSTWGARGRQFKSARPDHSFHRLVAYPLTARPTRRIPPLNSTAPTALLAIKFLTERANFLGATDPKPLSVACKCPRRRTAASMPVAGTPRSLCDKVVNSFYLPKSCV
jgi:hypothetical protein